MPEFLMSAAEVWQHESETLFLPTQYTFSNGGGWSQKVVGKTTTAYLEENSVQLFLNTLQLSKKNIGWTYRSDTPTNQSTRTWLRYFQDNWNVYQQHSSVIRWGLIEIKYRKRFRTQEATRNISDDLKTKRGARNVQSWDNLSLGIAIDETAKYAGYPSTQA